MTKKNINRVRGMYDITPNDSWLWENLEHSVITILKSYGYQQVRFPVVEKTALFHSSIGESTDVVEKEMFTFPDRKGESLSLRPEGTASVVRLMMQNGLLMHQPQKVWYACPMFRYERPQKGRNRQFDQVGAEVFGLSGPDIDAELLLMTYRMWHVLGLGDDIHLQVNSLGNHSSRERYRAVLIEYLEGFAEQMDEDARKRLYTNPMRILDSKNPVVKGIIENAPDLYDYLDDESKQRFEKLCHILDACQVPYEVNHRLVRGLDYYTHNVFEWVTSQLGAQGTVCAGGRYDKLVEVQGGKSTPATGFAMGVDRLIELIREKGIWKAPNKADLYVVHDDNWPTEAVFSLVEKLRVELKECVVLMHMGGGSFKSQFKKADKNGAKFAIILGKEERDEETVSIRSLVDRDFLQQRLALDSVIELLKENLV